jgi:hypothetical protein
MIHISIPSSSQLSVVFVTPIACIRLDFCHRFPSFVRYKSLVIESDVRPCAVSYIHQVPEEFTLLPHGFRYGMYAVYKETVKHLPVWMLKDIPSVDYKNNMPFMLMSTVRNNDVFVIPLLDSQKIETYVAVAPPVQVMTPDEVGDDKPQIEHIKPVCVFPKQVLC